LTLRFLVFGVLSLATMIPLLLFWAWPHSKALQNEMDAVADRNLLIAQTLGTAVGRYERDVRALFSLLADNLTEGRALSGGEQALADIGLAVDHGLRRHLLALERRDLDLDPALLRALGRDQQRQLVDGHHVTQRVTDLGLGLRLRVPGRCRQQPDPADP